MSDRPTLLFWCQHSLGLGHLARSFALCAGLAERFRVVLASGGTVPDAFAPPAGVEVVQLPALGMRTTGELVSRDGGRTVEQAQAGRRRMLLQTLAATAPSVVLVELFPFGRKKFAAEIVELLEAAHRLPRRPLVACSLRDILVSREDQERFDERAAGYANRLFDAILVHADPRFARLEESFRPRTPLAVPVHYTGFALPERDAVPLPLADREPEIVVSAGGGLVGEPLLAAALGAHETLWPRTGLRMKLIAGPFLPDAAWDALARRAAHRDGIALVRSVPDLRAVLSRARASVSQCGYNTALDLITARVPALVVPFSEPNQDEQSNRARRLEQLGLVRAFAPERLAPVALAEAIAELLAFRPRPAGLALDGTRQTARLLDELLASPRRAAEAAA
jgi:predicted glycosyltransferase